MKRKIIQRQTGEEQQGLGQNQAAQQAGQEFATVEDLLRHDAVHTPVPPAVGHRLAESVRNLPPPKPWWRRWLGS